MGLWRVHAGQVQPVSRDRIGDGLVAVGTGGDCFEAEVFDGPGFEALGTGGAVAVLEGRVFGFFVAFSVTRRLTGRPGTCRMGGGFALTWVGDEEASLLIERDGPASPPPPFPVGFVGVGGI